MLADWILDYDVTTWVPVPSEFPHLDYDSSDTWRDAMADDFIGRGLVTPSQRPLLLRLFATLHTTAAKLDSRGCMYAHLRDFARPCLPVFLDIRPVSDEDPFDRLDRDGGYGPPVSTEPPVDTRVRSTHLGEGKRRVRFATMPDGQDYAIVMYAFRAHGCDVLVHAQSPDLDNLMAAQPDIEAFVDGIAPNLDAQ